MTGHRLNKLTRLASICCALTATATSGAFAEVYTDGAPFQIRNQSGLTSAQAKFYYLGFGQIGNDFVVLMPDGTWATAGSPGTGWNPTGWNQTPPAPLSAGPSGAGVVPCYPLTTSSTINLPANIGGSRIYFFQVNSSSPLFNTNCANTASNTQTNGIFGNVLGSSGGQAPFSYFSKTLGGDVVTPPPAWLANGSMPIWSFGELGSGAGPGTIDTSQVDFIGFPMNVTAQMTALGSTYPVWNQGVGFSFSPNSQVNMNAVLASYRSFYKTLPVQTRSGGYRTNVQSNFKKLMAKQGSSTVIFNPGNYIADVDNSAFGRFFLNLINSYIWYPGAPSFGGLPAVEPWTGKLNTGGDYGALQQTTFDGVAVTLPAPGMPGAYPNYTGEKPLQAIKFTSIDTNAVAYVLSPVSYEVLCKASAVTAGCGSPAYQVFAAAGSLAAPGDNNQFSLLTTAEQDVWINQYGNVANYNAVVARLGLLISAAFNRGVAGGLQSDGGLCHGTTTLNDCWSNQVFWYPTPKTVSERRKFFGGDTTQNHFSRWLHTARISGIPMMTQPVNPTTLTSGAKMGMGYGFSNDENPTPQPAGSSQTPSKYDGIVEMSPIVGSSPTDRCNYITIMPWRKTPLVNTTPVLNPDCNPSN